jgi:hypothetical protein
MNRRIAGPQPDKVEASLRESRVSCAEWNCIAFAYMASCEHV